MIETRSRRTVMTATTAKIRERYRATGLTTGSSRRSRRSRQKVRHRSSPNSTISISEAFSPLAELANRGLLREAWPCQWLEF